jgi:hypothetical protein
MPHRFLAASIALGAVATAVAEASPTSDWRWTVEGGAVSELDASLDSGGEFGVDRYVVDLSAARRYASGTRVGVSLNYGQSRYDFSNAVQLGSSDPWGRIQQASLSASVFYALDDRWTVYGIPSLRFDGEDGVSFGDGDTLGLLAGASYRFSDRLTIGPGVGVFGELEDDTSLFPILIVDWKITDRLSLETGRGFAASRGPGLQLRWRQSPAWQFAFGGRYEKQRFRLDDDGVAPGGIGEDSSIPLFALAQYQASPSVALSLIGGVVTGGELRLEDADGKGLSKSDFDEAPFFGATLRVGL